MYFFLLLFVTHIHGICTIPIKFFMMDEELPKKFDLIVIGTGFPEACVAAAASRIDKSVLHIDPNEYYGSSWASFNLEAFHDLIEKATRSGNKEIKNCTHKWYIPKDDNQKSNNDNTAEGTTATSITDAGADKDAKTYTCIKRLMANSRKFNIDLCPKLLYSSGELVQLLISSNICRYAEFRACDHIWTFHQQQLLNVPCSRSDVFNTKDLTIIEKRLLMKFLNNCLTYNMTEEIENDISVKYHDKTFVEYLKDQQLTEKINHCIVQAISMTTDETSFNDGMNRIKKFLQSLGRYGNTPFIFPMYGCGELPQCFCRLCAVYGGVYCLNKQITKIIMGKNGSKVFVEVDGHNIESDYVVCSPGNLPQPFKRKILTKNILSRGVILSTKASISNRNEIGCSTGGGSGADIGGVSLLRLVLPNTQREAFCIQLSHHSGTCPKGVYILHLITTAMSDTPFYDLQPFQEQIFNSSDINSQILYTAYFTIIGYDINVHLDSNLTSRLFCTMAPSYALDYDEAIDNGHSIFKKLYGGNVEFLPRAPDPEEIVIDGEDPQAAIEIQLPENLRAQLQELSVVTTTEDVMDVEEKEFKSCDANNDNEVMETKE